MSQFYLFMVSLGGPNHFAPYIPLVPPDFTVCNILFKGHGGSVRDFSRAGMSEWKEQVQTALDELLKSHDKVIIAAHSMGTLFAIQEAIKKPVDELFLLNVPLKLHIKSRIFKTAGKIFFKKIDPNDKWTIAAQNTYSIEEDSHILRYLGWIPRYLELFSEIRRTNKIVDRLSVRSHIYLSLQDEMVTPKTRDYFKNNIHAEVKILNNSGHFYYSPEDQSLLIEDFKRMI